MPGQSYFFVDTISIKIRRYNRYNEGSIVAACVSGCGVCAAATHTYTRTPNTQILLSQVYCV